MIKNHAIYKKIAIGTIVVAPFLAQLASHQTPATQEVPAAPVRTPAPAPTAITAITAQPSALLTGGPFDPKPSLDPAAAASAMTGQTPDQAAPAPPVNVPAPGPAPVASPRAPAPSVITQ